MSLRRTGHVELPANIGRGGFDHAAVHAASGHLYVAHTANDAVDVIDMASGRYLRSVPGLSGVAGVLVSETKNLVFTSNRAEDTVSIFQEGREAEAEKVSVGIKPNGLAFAPSHNLLLVANVGDPAVRGSQTISMVDVRDRVLVSSIAVPDRTRWAIYDDALDAFYVNIRDPSQIAVVSGREPGRVECTIPVPATGPHGLELDAGRRCLFCACDAGKLFTLQLPSGEVVGEYELSGTPDVIFHNALKDRLYVAVGDPGVIDVFDTRTMEMIETCRTENGAHTIALDATGNRVYAFLPETHRASVYTDEGA